MVLDTVPVKWLKVEMFLATFEAAQAAGKRPDLADFLPPPDHSLHDVVLREMIRVDLENSWSRRCPKALEEYRRQFPALFQDQDAVREIAFEEYRQRRESGDNPSPQEYQRLYGVNTEGWPAPVPVPSPAGQ